MSSVVLLICRFSLVLWIWCEESACCLFCVKNSEVVCLRLYLDVSMVVGVFLCVVEIVMSSAYVMSEVYILKRVRAHHFSLPPTCCANSLVGARTSAWHSRTLISIFCKIATEKVAVFPVPDWAWAITS